MKKCGVSRVRVWLQESPEGAVAIVLYEGQTPAGFQQQMATSSEPFSVWFRQRVKELHGMDLAKAAGSPPELISDACAT